MAPRRRQKAHQQRRRLVAARRKKTAGFDKEKGGNVEEWVYRFLGNLAAIEENKNRAKKHVRVATVHFAKPKRRSLHRRFRSPTPFSWDRVARGAATSSRVQHRHPGDSDDEVDVLLPPRNAKPADAVSATNSSDKSGRDRTLLQRINRYIRAGIAEGKRRAKRYVQKALSFALETGYLVPADREGKLLRVSHSLVKPVSEAKPGRKRKSSGKVQKRKQQQQQHRSRSRKRSSAVGRRKSIVGQGDESRQNKRQARKKPSEESSAGSIVEDARQHRTSGKTPSSGGSRNNRTSCSRSPPRSGARHQETMSASKVERKTATLPSVAPARPRSAPNTRGPE